MKAPLPWKHDGFGIYIFDDNSNMVADGDPDAPYVVRMRGVGAGHTPEEQAEIAAFIVKASNAHETLVTALSLLAHTANRLCDRNLGGTYEDDCRVALAKAREALKGVK